MPLPCAGHLGHGQHCCGGHRSPCHELGTQEPPGLLGLWALWSLLGMGDHSCGDCCSWKSSVWALLLLLPSSMWSWVPLLLGRQSCVHNLPCYYEVLWGADSCHSQRAEVSGTTFTVSLVLPSVYVPIRSINERIAPASCLCWIEHPLLNHKSSVLPVVDRRREMKRAHYNTVMLIITILLIGHFFPKVYFYFPCEIFENFCSGLAAPCSRF